jgi:hypothetical protein
MDIKTINRIMEQQKNENESMRLYNIAQEQRINIQKELKISCEEYYRLIKEEL